MPLEHVLSLVPDVSCALCMFYQQEMNMLSNNYDKIADKVFVISVCVAVLLYSCRHANILQSRILRYADNRSA